MPPEKPVNPFLLALGKIPLFLGIDPPKIKRILALSTHKVYQPEQVLCRSGTPSQDLYVLLSGELAVVTNQDFKIATIHPVTTVGEMGLITGQPRSATVKATKPSHVFIVGKQQLAAAVRNDQVMQAMIHLNIIEILSHKIENNNAMFSSHQLDKERGERHLQQLERHCENQVRRAELAAELALQGEGVSREELEQYVEEQIGVVGAKPAPGRAGKSLKR